MTQKIKIGDLGLGQENMTVLILHELDIYCRSLCSKMCVFRLRSLRMSESLFHDHDGALSESLLQKDNTVTRSTTWRMRERASFSCTYIYTYILLLSRHESAAR